MHPRSIGNGPRDLAQLTAQDVDPSGTTDEESVLGSVQREITPATSHAELPAVFHLQVGIGGAALTSRVVENPTNRPKPTVPATWLWINGGGSES
jgi:hypothetical protein